MSAAAVFPQQPEPLNQAAAAKLDKKLRNQARAVAHSMERFKPLIDEAKAGRVHEALGFASWPAYVSDVIGKEMGRLAVEDRRQIVELLAGEGMSQRAIADAVGVNHATISRDRAAIEAEQVLHGATRQDEKVITVTVVRDPAEPTEARPLLPDEQARMNERIREDREKIAAQLRARDDSEPVDLDQRATVTGLDGKTYPKPPPQKPKPRNMFVDRFAAAAAQLQSAALRLQLLTKDEQFAAHHATISREYRDGVVWVQEIITATLAQMHTDQCELFGDIGEGDLA